MDKEKWPQPNWFWWTIGSYLVVEYILLFVLVLTGATPIDLITLSQFLSIVFPMFLIITLMLLPKKVRFDSNTVFYLFMPLLLFIPNWTLVSIYFNEIF